MRAQSTFDESEVRPLPLTLAASVSREVLPKRIAAFAARTDGGDRVIVVAHQLSSRPLLEAVTRCKLALDQGKVFQLLMHDELLWGSDDQ
ncbi:MAG: hypothetical protein AABM32_04680 [Chloroflexota bacterium]